MKITKPANLFRLIVAFAVIASVYLVIQISLLSSPSSDSQRVRAEIDSRLDALQNGLAENRQLLGQLQDTVRQLVQSEDRPQAVRHARPPVGREAITSNVLQAPVKETQSVPSRQPDGEPVDSGADNAAVVLSPPRVLVAASSSQTSATRTLNLEGHCDFGRAPPQSVDIQMLDVYNSIPFDNPDGGAWKQGWEITYSADQWNADSKLRVFVVPHSHNDPGWLKTFEQYYATQTRKIFNSMLSAMDQFPKMKFIWAEISYLDLWWREASDENRVRFKSLVESGRLELVSGGWVMPDEANSHIYSMLEQLITGHEWLQLNMNASVRNGWSIDPFGLSPTQAYLLRRSGLSHMLIQRSHYVIKRQLARHQQLEFWWRQTWDSGSSTDMFCHMMPFYSYDVPHSCGPDPKVCCQFDFLRMPGGRGSCPWRVPPRPITSSNVASRAALLLDQYRKKSQLYRSNVLLVPLGDDFRYDSVAEWAAQYNNYQQLFDYLNSHQELHVQIEFGTLSDYFGALEDEAGRMDPLQAAEGPGGGLAAFPRLSGDFFTYADKNDEYWSGYYTSRPFYKRMDRLLIGYLRAAELLFSQFLAVSGPSASVHSSAMMKDLVLARRALSLFQHHDGVTGTSKTLVMSDYGSKLMSAVHGCQRVMELSARSLLLPDRAIASDVIYWHLDEVLVGENQAPQRRPLFLTPDGPPATVVLYNSLTRRRRETVSVLVSSPYVEVKHMDSGAILDSQSAPLYSTVHTLVPDTHQVTFEVDLMPYSLTVYQVKLTRPGQNSRHVLCDVIYVNGGDVADDVAPYQVRSAPAAPFSLHSPHLVAEFSQHGVLQAVTPHGHARTEVSVEFVMYGVERVVETSGAYLFKPDSAARTHLPSDWPYRVVRGPISSQVAVQVSGELLHSVSLAHLTDVQDAGWLEVRNMASLLTSESNNRELAMRFSTSVNSGDRFVTDLNAFQTIERRMLSKLPLQGNFYPLPKLMYVEDYLTRVTLVTGQPLGCASLASGQLEVMLDRRLKQDDNRGLGQGVMDNLLTPSYFRLLVEPVEGPTVRAQPVKPLVSLLAHWAHQSLINPVYRLVSGEDSPVVPPTAARTALSASSPAHCDLDLVTLRRMTAQQEQRGPLGAHGRAAAGDEVIFRPSARSLMVVQHVAVDCRIQLPQQLSAAAGCNMSNGKFSIDDMAPEGLVHQAHLSTLQGTRRLEAVSPRATTHVAPMEMQAFLLASDSS